MKYTNSESSAAPPTPATGTKVPFHATSPSTVILLMAFFGLRNADGSHSSLGCFDFTNPDAILKLALISPWGVGIVPDTFVSFRPR